MYSKVFLFALIAAVLIVACFAEMEENVNVHMPRHRVARQYFGGYGYPYGGGYNGFSHGGSAAQAQAQSQSLSNGYGFNG